MKTESFSNKDGELVLYQQYGGPTITVNTEEACALGERLLRWAAQQDTDPNGRRDWTSIESRLASHLWSCSTLRHGMFTPPEFSDLCEIKIREFFQIEPESPPEAT